MKTCKKCGVTKPLADFYKMAQMRDGYRNDCKACNLAAKAARYRENPEPTKERVRKWQAENRERLREWQRLYAATGKKAKNDRRSHLKRTYGLTVEQYDEMLASQGGGCGICGRAPREDIALHVDHDHETGRVRGIACFRCNNALGDLNDDPKLLEAASAYLDRHDPESQELRAIAKQRARELVSSTLF